jgi:hypothetical protein
MKRHWAEQIGTLSLFSRDALLINFSHAGRVVPRITHSEGHSRKSISWGLSISDKMSDAEMSSLAYVVS